MRTAAWRTLTCQSTNSVGNVDNNKQGPAFLDSPIITPEDNLAILKDIWAKA